MSTFKGERNNITINLEVDKILLNLDTAVPLGLIINEIISNALKHGILGNKEGTIGVHLQEIRPGFFKLNIGDDGVGIPKGVTIEESESLGFTLITSLIEQLDGKYYLNSSQQGTHYDISFHKQK